MKHTMVTFRLHKTGVLLVIGGALLLGVLIFAAGYLAAARRGPALPKVPQLPAAAALPLPATAPPPSPSSAAVPPAAAAASSPAAPAAESFTLRVAAFATEQEAKASADGLAARGFQASVVPVPTGGATVLYTVRVGSYSTRAAAAAMADRLSKEHAIEAAVIPFS